MRLVSALSSMLCASKSEGKVATEEGSEDGPSENSNWVGANQLAHKRHARVLQHTHNILSHQIQILFTHFSDLKIRRKL